jgi:hypothetical protein
VTPPPGTPVFSDTPVYLFAPLLLIPLLLWFFWPLLAGSEAVSSKKPIVAEVAVAAPAPPPPVPAPAPPKKKWATVDASNYIWARSGGGAAPIRTEWGALGAVKSAPGAVNEEVKDASGASIEIPLSASIVSSKSYREGRPSCCARCYLGCCRCFLGCYLKVASMRPERASVKNKREGGAPLLNDQL